MALDRRYWDSDCFLGVLNGEQDKLPHCQSVLDAAERGQLVIVTSALTIAEVLHVKGQQALPSEKREIISRFFKNPYISIQNVTRPIAEYAQMAFWDFGIEPKDAVHVATAIKNRIPVLNTFDRNLLNASGKIGDPPLKIEIPHEPGQQKLI